MTDNPPRDRSRRFFAPRTAHDTLSAIADHKSRHGRLIDAIHGVQPHAPTATPAQQLDPDLVAAREARIVAQRDLQALERKLDPLTP